MFEVRSSWANHRWSSGSSGSISVEITIPPGAWLCFASKTSARFIQRGKYSKTSHGKLNRTIGLDSLGSTAFLGLLRTTFPSAKGLTVQQFAALDTVNDLVDILSHVASKTPPLGCRCLVTWKLDGMNRVWWNVFRVRLYSGDVKRLVIWKFVFVSVNARMSIECLETKPNMDLYCVKWSHCLMQIAITILC